MMIMVEIGYTLNDEQRARLQQAIVGRMSTIDTFVAQQLVDAAEEVDICVCL